MKSNLPKYRWYRGTYLFATLWRGGDDKKLRSNDDERGDNMMMTCDDEKGRDVKIDVNEEGGGDDDDDGGGGARMSYAK